MPNFQVVERAFLFPQLCISCRRALDQECLDTGINLPQDEGRLYFCYDCIDDIAATVGLMKRGEAAALVKSNKEHQEAVQRLPQAVEAIKNDIGNAIARGFAVLAGDDGGDSRPAPVARPPRVPAKPRITTADLDASRVPIES